MFLYAVIINGFFMYLQQHTNFMTSVPSLSSESRIGQNTLDVELIEDKLSAYIYERNMVLQ